MKSIQEAFFIIFILLFSSFSSLVSAEENEFIECEILTDWSLDYVPIENTEGNFSIYDSLIIHRYVVSFFPSFVNGSAPHLVETSVNHLRSNQTIGNEFNSNVILAENGFGYTFVFAREFSLLFFEVDTHPIKPFLSNLETKSHIILLALMSSISKLPGQWCPPPITL